MNNPRPPRLAARLLVLLLPAPHRDQILGDLREGFALRVARDGRLRPRLWYWRQLLSTDLLLLHREARTTAPRPAPRRKNVTMIFDGITTDLAYALRGLRKTPLFTITTLTTLALGIGLSTAIFTAVNAVLLRPLPYPDGDELVMVFRTVPRFEMARSVASYPDFVDWRERVSTLDDIAAYGYAEATWLGDDGAEKWTGRRVTRNLLALLGAEPAHGRGFTEAEDRAGGPAAIILSHGVWQTRFGADPAILGTSLRFDDETRTVVGVMPAGFAFPGPETSFWLPLRGDVARMERDTNFLQVIGRLADGSTVADAQREIETLAATIDAEVPGANDGYGIFVETRRDFVVRGARQALWVFAGAVALVFLIACSNVANLMLVRATARGGEMSLRVALGAGRGRLFRLLLTESALIAAVGGALGVGTAWLLLRLALVLAEGQLPRSGDIRLDAGALGFSLVLSAGCALVFGAAPAWSRLRTPTRAGAGVSGTAGGSSRGRRAAQHALVALQVALALILVLSAALLMNSFVRLTSIDPGFDPRGVVAGRVALPDDAPPEMDMDDMTATEMATAMRNRVEARDGFVRELLQQAGASPSVEAIGVSYGLPLGPSSFSRTMIPAGAEATEEESPAIPGNIVGGDYFDAMGMRLLAGRAFDNTDRFDAPPVMLVNETLAATFWPGESPLGQRVRIGGPDNPWVTVVGVVADVRDASLAADPQPRYYRSLAQVAWPDALFVVVRSGADTEETVASLRAAVARLDARLPLTDVTTTAGLVDSALAAPRLRTALLTLFGALATALALIGTYGTVSHVVADRRHELGVRLAIGARGSDLIGQVLAREMRPVLIGVVMGLTGTTLAARLLAGFLFGVGPFHPGTYVAAATAMVIVLGIACYVPARRAATVPPNEALRAQ